MARPRAADRIRRMLSMLPWIAAQPDGAPLDEICERFGVDRTRLQADLDLATMIGIPPYTPDKLIEVWVEDDRAHVLMGEYFKRPMNLTHDEAVALVTAGLAAIAVDGEADVGPLSRGLQKLANVLRIDLDSDVSVTLGTAPENLVGLLRDAVDERRCVDVTYYSYARDEWTERVVEPDRVRSADGEWYLDAFCRSAGAERVFRIDRIRSARPIDERFDRPAGRGQTGDVGPGADAVPVTIEVDADGRWVAERYPILDATDLADGGMRVTLAVSAAPWLGRLLVILGPAARVVDGPDDWRDIGARTAHRILERYR